MYSFRYHSDLDMCLSSAQTLQGRVADLVGCLENRAGYFPGRLDDCLDQLRPLFHAEEELMIRTKYPDYPMSRLAHNSFLYRMLSLREQDRFWENEEHAASWLTEHEKLDGSMFLSYLQRLAPPRERYIPEPDHVLLGWKIVR